MNPRTDTEQKCRDCDEWKPFDQFYRHSSGGLRGSCKICWCAASRRHQKANPDKYREYARTTRSKTTKRELVLRQKYGMTLADYQQRLDDQGGVCLICKGESGDTILHVDHCHETGKFRGILCGLCNRMLGQAQDNPSRLRLAADYLDAFILKVVA